jgi:hypothetical protein
MKPGLPAYCLAIVRVFNKAASLLAALVLLHAVTLRAAEQSTLPEPKKYQGTTYLTGGADPAQGKAMREAAQDYGLQIYLYVKRVPVAPGEVKVTVLDQGGDKLVEASAEGPLFFVKVKGGRYTIRVERDGQSQEKTFDLVGRRTGEFFFDFSQ